MSRSAFRATHIALFVVGFFSICDGVDSNRNEDGDNDEDGDDIDSIVLLWMLTSLIFMWIYVEPFTLFTFTIVSSAFKIKFECFFLLGLFYYDFLLEAFLAFN